MGERFRSLANVARPLFMTLVILVQAAVVACGPAGEPESGAVLVFGRGADSVGLDPAHEEDGESFKVAELIYDTLVHYKVDSTEVEPGLATAWSASADGLVWTFTLREGIRFHDGTLFDADAVVQSFRRQYDERDPLNAVGGPYLYWLSLGMDDVIEGVEAIGSNQVEIRLKQPYSPLLGVLATPPFSIASPTAMKTLGDDFKAHPVGTGPFKFDEWRRDDRIILARNDDYWGGKSEIERIVFRAIPDNATRLLEIERGAIHILDNPDLMSVESVSANPRLRLIKRPGMNVGYVAMNMDHAPLNDARIRRAINHAIDKKTLVETLYNGLATPAKNPLPPTIWGYNDSIQDFEYDPEKARSLVQEAFPNSFPRPLSFYALSNDRPYFPSPQNIALAIQSDLEKVGIPTEIETFEWMTYLANVKKGDHDLAMLGWIADYADPDNFLYFNLSRENARPPAGNIAFYRSDEMQELLVSAQRETDQAKRVELYQTAQEVFRRDAPWIAVAHAETVVVIRDTIRNFTPHPTSWRHLWRVSLAPANDAASPSAP